MSVPSRTVRGVLDRLRAVSAIMTGDPVLARRSEDGMTRIVAFRVGRDDGMGECRAANGGEQHCSNSGQES